VERAWRAGRLNASRPKWWDVCCQAESPTGGVASPQSKRGTRTQRSGIHLVVAAHVSGSRLPNSRVLRWLFRRGNQFLSLELRHTPGGAYTFSLTPLGSDTRGVETIDTGVRAFERHEAIATQLRQSGWKVVAFTAHRREPLQSRVALILERI